MDEYIKREDVIKHLRGACIAKYPLSFSYGIFASADEIRKLLPADVVPKSEYDAVVSAVDNSTKEFLKLHDDYQDAIHMVERLKNILDSYAFQYGTVTDKQAIINHERAEVAKEIFEEVEVEITEALKCNYKRRTEYYTKERYNKEDVEFINAVNGKIDALRGVEGFIAELKKKYTERKEDEGK